MKARTPLTTAAVLLCLAGCRSPALQTADSSGAQLWPRAAGDNQPAGNIPRADSFSGRGGAGGNVARAGDPEADPARLARSLLEQGRAAEADQQWGKARRHYRNVLQVDPAHPTAHHRLAVIADKQGDFAEAEEHYLTALRARPNDPNLLSDLGYSFLIQDRYEESRYYLNQALRFAPAHSKALNNLGLLRARQGDYDGALAMFRKAGSEREAMEKMRILFPDGKPAGTEPALARARPPAPSEPGSVDSFGASTSNAVLSDNGPQPASSFPADAQRDARNNQQQLPAPSPEFGVREQLGHGQIPLTGADRQMNQNSGPDQYPPTWPPPDGQPRRASGAIHQPAAEQPSFGDLISQTAEGPAQEPNAGPQGAQSNGLPRSSKASQDPLDSLPVWPPKTDDSIARREQSADSGESADQRPKDVRQEAALVGMNAGPGVMFPVLPDRSRSDKNDSSEPAEDKKPVAPAQKTSSSRPPSTPHRESPNAPANQTAADPPSSPAPPPQINPRQPLPHTAARPPADGYYDGSSQPPPSGYRESTAPARYRTSAPTGRYPAKAPSQPGTGYSNDPRFDQRPWSDPYAPRRYAPQIHTPPRNHSSSGMYR